MDEFAYRDVAKFVSRAGRTRAMLITQKETDAATLCHCRKMP